MKSIMILAAALVLSLGACTKKSTEAVPGKVSGMITVSPELQQSLKNTDVLYIIARSQQVGPPSAVKRFAQPKFPLSYTIGPEDSMMPGAQGFADGSTLTIAARVSRTGNAMPSAGDLEGVYAKNPARPGDSGVDVAIDRERKN